MLSLKNRLLGPMALLFLLGTAGLYVAARTYAAAAADTSFDRLIAGSALSIAESLSAAGSTVDVDIPYAALDMLSAAPDDRVFYRVTGPPTCPLRPRRFRRRSWGRERLASSTRPIAASECVLSRYAVTSPSQAFRARSTCRSARRGSLAMR